MKPSMMTVGVALRSNAPNLFFLYDVFATVLDEDAIIYDMVRTIAYKVREFSLFLLVEFYQILVQM